MSETKAVLLQIIGGLAVAALVLVSVAFGAEKVAFPADVEFDLAIERAAKRVDQKQNARWMALLDSIMVEVHEQFLLEYKAEIDSLSRARTDSLISKPRRE